MKKPMLLAPLLLTLTLGCTRAAFVRGPLPTLVNPDPQATRQIFAGTIPQRFISDDTVIIHAPFHDIAVLGVVRIDRPAGTFELVGLSQLGVRLFAVGGDRQQCAVRFAIPPLDQHRDLLLAIGADIRRMYFDLLPSPAARADARRTFVRFTDRNAAGTLLFEVGGAPPVLLEKRQAGVLGTIWRVQYFQYIAAAGALYPRGIVMDNDRYLYQIVVKNRDWEKQ